MSFLRLCDKHIYAHTSAWELEISPFLYLQMALNKVNKTINEKYDRNKRKRVAAEGATESERLTLSHLSDRQLCAGASGPYQQTGSDMARMSWDLRSTRRVGRLIGSVVGLVGGPLAIATSPLLGTVGAALATAGYGLTKGAKIVFRSAKKVVARTRDT